MMRKFGCGGLGAANGFREAFYFHGETAEIILHFIYLLVFYSTMADDQAEAAEVFPGRGSRQVLRHRHLIISTLFLATVSRVVCCKDSVAGFYTWGGV